MTKVGCRSTGRRGLLLVAAARAGEVDEGVARCEAAKRANEDEAKRALTCLWMREDEAARGRELTSVRASVSVTVRGRRGGRGEGQRTDVLTGLAVRRTEREEARGSQLALALVAGRLELVKLPHLLDPGSPPQLPPPPDDALGAAGDRDEHPRHAREGREGRGRVGEREGDVRVEEGERGEGRAEGGDEGGLRGGFVERTTSNRKL
mgnify:FL=1